MSRDFHFSLDAHVLQGVSLAVSETIWRRVTTFPTPTPANQGAQNQEADTQRRAACPRCVTAKQQESSQQVLNLEIWSNPSIPLKSLEK